MQLVLEPVFLLKQALILMILVLTQYGNGLLVKYKNVKVNYTRKINHFIMFIVPIYLNQGYAYQGELKLFILGSALAVLKLVIYIKPIRERVAFIKTMFCSFDRPEDRPHTLLWLATQMSAGYLVILVMGIIFAHYDLLHFIIIPILICGIGDGLAEPVGVRFGKRKYYVHALFTQKKYQRTLEGSACIFLTAFIVIIVYYSSFTPSQFFAALAIVPALTTLSEAFSPHSWDSPLIFLTGYLSLLGISLIY